MLLTDGISEEGDSISLAKEAAGEHITISTISLARTSTAPISKRSPSSPRADPTSSMTLPGLEQILLKDVMEHTGSTAIEKPVGPWS